MYVKRNIEARSCSHFGRGKVISITYSECVFVALSIRYSKSKRHIVICGLTGFTVFLHIISYTLRFFDERSPIKLCFDFLYNLQAWRQKDSTDEHTADNPYPSYT